MAGKGAPKGNQYAKKSQRDRGISVSLYLNAYDYEVLQKFVAYDGREPTIANVRKKVKELVSEALGREVRRTFARYAQEQKES